ncbi:uncharacterized protein [Equus asinus]|uniref:uncharacterized protein n=1 Tax=Equus asinus TaxID=9793 RepID=UPI0038F5E6A5
MSPAAPAIALWPPPPGPPVSPGRPRPPARHCREARRPEVSARAVFDLAPRPPRRQSGRPSGEPAGSRRRLVRAPGLRLSLSAGGTVLSRCRQARHRAGGRGRGAAMAAAGRLPSSWVLLAPLLGGLALPGVGPVPARALHNVTAELFGAEAWGTLAAFGDLNSDKQTDLFVLRERNDLIVFLADQNAPYFKPKVKVSLNSRPEKNATAGGDDTVLTPHPDTVGLKLEKEGLSRKLRHETCGGTQLGSFILDSDSLYVDALHSGAVIRPLA